MPAKKKKISMIEGYKNFFERYKTVAEKKKHEKGESKADMAKESKREKALAAKKKSAPKKK
jgi:hypothetical protein